jgi:hypothetical protein
VKPGDAARVLASCMMFDGRQMPEDRDQARDLTLAWFSVIGDLELTDALEAVRRHYMTTRKWAMPVDIRDGVKAIRQERLALEGEPHEIRSLPSPFEKDVDRQARLKAGMGEARGALQQVFQAMALRSGSPAAKSALEELRELTAKAKQAGEEGRVSE